MEHQNYNGTGTFCYTICYMLYVAGTDIKIINMIEILMIILNCHIDITALILIGISKDSRKWDRGDGSHQDLKC